MERRVFLKTATHLGLLATFGWLGMGCRENAGPSIALPDLPYPPDALEPVLSARTLSIHHGKHHRHYVAQTRERIDGTRFRQMPLVDIVRSSHADKRLAVLFNNAAQSYNHAFYWQSMTPGGGGPPTGIVQERLEAAFGGYGRFCDRFAAAAKEQFGSGWVWLVTDATGSRMAIVRTDNAGTPVTGDAVPLICIDLWEHAYYLDYQNRRGDYVRAFLEHLVNWDFAKTNLTAVPGGSTDRAAAASTRPDSV